MIVVLQWAGLGRAEYIGIRIAIRTSYVQADYSRNQGRESRVKDMRIYIGNNVHSLKISRATSAPT